MIELLGAQELDRVAHGRRRDGLTDSSEAVEDPAGEVLGGGIAQLRGRIDQRPGRGDWVLERHHAEFHKGGQKKPARPALRGQRPLTAAPSGLRITGGGDAAWTWVRRR